MTSARRSARPEGATMRSLTVTGPGTSALVRTPRPRPPAGWALVRCLYNALCGTDLKLFAGELHDAAYPVVPGHEWSGEVVEAGGDASRLVGRRVVGDNFICCGACSWCRRGLPNLCSQLDELGFTRPGACADYLLVPARNLVALPDHVDPAAACLAEPLGVALHALERAPVTADDRVAVLGGGAVGLLLAQAVRATAPGAPVLVVEPRDRRARVARSLGFDAVADAGAHAGAGLPGGPPTVTFDATGQADAFPLACALTAPRGRVVVVGYSGAQVTAFAPAAIMLAELDVVGVLSGVGQTARAVDLIAAGAVDPGPLVGAVFALDDYARALAAAADPAADHARVLLRPGATGEARR